MAAERATQPQDDVRSEQGGGQSMRSANTGMTGRSSRSGRSWRVTPATFADVEKARSKQQANRPGNSSADGAEQPDGSVEAPTLMQQIQDNAQTLGVLGFLIFVSLIGTFPQVALWIAALQVSAIFCFAQSITYFMPCVCVCVCACVCVCVRARVGPCRSLFACVCMRACICAMCNTACFGLAVGSNVLLRLEMGRRSVAGQGPGDWNWEVQRLSLILSIRSLRDPGPLDGLHAMGCSCERHKARHV